jgi:hypothetical protein
MTSAPLHRARPRTRPKALALGFGLFLARAGAAAPAETEPIRIEYSAPSGCPDAGAFRSRVFERTSKARPAGESELARTFVVLIEVSGANTEGSLVVREDGMSTMARRVSGKNCDEVARALALATALAIDPEAALGPTPESTGSGDGSANAPSTAADTKNPEPGAATKASDEPPAAKPAPSAANERRLALLVGPGVAFGPAPNPSFGVSAALEWSTPNPAVLPAAVGLELAFRTSAKQAVAGAKSSFQFALARPYVCTLGFAVGAFGVVPCVGGELGAVLASGSAIANPTKETRFWAAAELALRFDVALSTDWFADATASAVFPFTRYQFVFETPETSIYDVPVVTAAAGVRIGRRL